jgi:hypothetical protein
MRDQTLGVADADGGDHGSTWVGDIDICRLSMLARLWIPMWPTCWVADPSSSIFLSYSAQ